MPITTYGVPQRGCRRPIALGICRLVASRYPTRETPSIERPGGGGQAGGAADRHRVLEDVAQPTGCSASTTPTSGALMWLVPSAVTPSLTGSMPTPTIAIPTYTSTITADPGPTSHLICLRLAVDLAADARRGLQPGERDHRDRERERQDRAGRTRDHAR